MSGIFLIGFMASGKSQVAKRLAKRLSMPFVDLDMHIESQSGQSIAAIFQSGGEVEFRRLEREALASALAGVPSVVATGGGCACSFDNLERMKAAGRVVHLSTPLSTCLSRAREEGTSSTALSNRPLLSQPPEEIESLYRARAPIYRRAQLSVSTEDKTPELVASDIELALQRADMASVDSEKIAVVALQERSYPVVVEPNCLKSLGTALREKLPNCKTVGLLSDDNVFALYGAKVRQALEASGFRVEEAVVSPGEESKEIGVFQSLSETLIEKGLDRSSVIVALGGGVVGDLAGFVAASLFRGIALVQVPTTLLAMTDSSIGGKTGVNSALGKNLIGAFWQPKLVWADPLTLSSLPKRERVAAFGELVKYALLDDAIWPMVVRCAQGIGDESEEGFVVEDALSELIRACAALKAAIVSADERESGLRATLNLGHTVAHAIESAAGYGSVLHGEAVALGLLATCRVSHALGYCSDELESQVSKILTAAGLDVELEPWLRSDVLAHIGVDKKRTGSSVRFVVVSKPGDIRLHEIELAELISLLQKD